MPVFETSTTTSMKSPSPPISPRLLSYLFTSLSSHSPIHTPDIAPLLPNSPPRKWYLRRILRSDNPTEINGELTGIATFHPLINNHNNSNIDNDRKHKHREMVYREEGEMPSTVPGMAGLKWTKKYIWRLNNSSNDALNTSEDAKETDENLELSAGAGGISIWFVKIKSGRERNKEDQETQEEADYLFHKFDFGQQQGNNDTVTVTDEKTGTLSLQPPTPPLLASSSTLAQAYPETEVIHARGDHLCVKDMYYTAYSFRIVPETGEVLSWASRHVVKGPKKNQDIVNLYSIEG
ncbi:hypothetical protein UA08_02445 [Talaromyces atroroseus]|uniref:DUF6314 domain-containing protein n=1 Tax=Talaromyces atroroseus TaxID=1441469 RepID=A0A225AQF0_TALAT|nr:hypothetical protein UA08_02445 [Talaromyces atroroseus]OKL61723.1 hypothetical protein UA08_02445 [Talaromyces atroroseus]